MCLSIYSIYLSIHLSDHICFLSCYVLSCLSILSCLILPYLIFFYLSLSYFILSIYMFIYLNLPYLSLPDILLHCLSIYLPTYLSICLSMNLFHFALSSLTLSSSIYLSIYLSIYPFIHPSTYLYISCGNSSHFHQPSPNSPSLPVIQTSTNHPQVGVVYYSGAPLVRSTAT